MSETPWESLGKQSPRGLVPARLLLHHAAQLAAAVGRSLVPARPDDGHTSLEWTPSPRGLASQEVAGARPWRALLGLGEPAPALALLAGGAEVDRLALEGRTRREAFEWLDERARSLGAPASRLSLEAPYVLPAHPYGGSDPFVSPGDGAVGELARWFADGDAVLRGVAAGWPGRKPVRVWPHHFDVGSVLPLGGGTTEDAPSVSIGLSPGDEGIAEPYFYVTPWPPPAPTEELPSLLSGGRWHREGWTGAVLTGSEVVAQGDGAAQAAAAKTFLAGAVQVLRARHDARRR
jgi:hypothetical protein